MSRKVLVRFGDTDWSLTMAEADAIIARIQEAKRVATVCDCGHDEEDHDGGMGGSWCNGSGTYQMHHQANRDQLCKCKSYCVDGKIGYG